MAVVPALRVVGRTGGVTAASGAGAEVRPSVVVAGRACCRRRPWPVAVHGHEGSVGANGRCKAAVAARWQWYAPSSPQSCLPCSPSGHRFGFGPLGSPGTALLPLGSASSCTSSSTARLALHMLTRPETRGEPGNKDEMADAACKCAGAIGLSNPGRQLPCLLASPSPALHPASGLQGARYEAHCVCDVYNIE